MSVLGHLLLSGQDGYTISRSVRLRSSASAYFSRTPASAGNRKTWTWSGWVKRGSLGAGVLFMGGATLSDTGATAITFYSDQIYIQGYVTNWLVTTQVFRDPSAWYHVVVAMDSTNATANNRLRLYINGAEVTAFSTRNNLTLNTDYGINQAALHTIGYQSAAFGGSYLDGYLTEINFIDGQALTPSSFGSTNATTGVWQPIKYTGTYGTNGFYLNFSDNSNNTATTIGKDYSGNGNNWTPNNISVTSGATYDSMTDVPTLTSESAANYCVLNPLAMYGTNAVISNANLTSSATSTSNDRGWASTIAAPNSGKWYAEFTFTSTLGDNNGGCGVMLENGTGVPGESATTVSWRDAGTLRQNATGTSYGSALTTNDVVIVAYDAASGSVWFGKNGTWFASGNPATNANPSATGITSSGRFATYHYNSSAVIQANFGQRPFAYTPPTGFVALNTQNLPAPTISNGALYMAASLYTGTSGNVTVSNAVNGISFQPDFLWVKARSNAQGHNQVDSVRGASKLLQSNLTNAESTLTNPPSFNSNGFTSTTDIHTNGYTYVAWQWQAGAGTTSSNTSGSITSTVSVNATAGFSVVTYTGTGANATVGHGLGVAPNMIILKQRNASTADWGVYHSSIGNTGLLKLNTTDSTITTSTMWNNTSPTSSVFSLGTNITGNGNTTTYVAYCFSAVRGYSAFGSYTGNGSSDGPFVYLGFRPRWVMMKNYSSAGDDWMLFDSSRNTYNVTDLNLRPDTSGAESSQSANYIDFLSNGFKIRGTSAGSINASQSYIYAAFAENPFKLALAR